MDDAEEVPPTAPEQSSVDQEPPASTATNEPKGRRRALPSGLGSRRGRTIGRALLSAVILAVAGYLGGVTVTALWPIMVQTQHYSAEVSINPAWSANSQVHTPTVFGDVNLSFQGPLPAPGITARVQVREEITELFTSGGLVDVEDFTPDQAELGRAMQAGLRELGSKFVGGVVGTQLLVAGLWMVGRGRRPGPALISGATVAAVLATALPGLSAATTYRQQNFLSFDVTSLLGTVRSNAGMFTDIQGAARQATPYVYNLLALSDALQAEFLPPEATSDPGARFLLVSDVHGMNYYSLMQSIVENENITAVIDTGDLLNFGQVREGEISGIFAAIEELEVPYIFVRGNHDAIGPQDEGVLQAMAQIPNVILVEPTAGEYLLANINGITIAGFNDWRFFAEQRDDFGAQQQAAADRYAEATEGAPPPDVLISHQPYGLRGLETAAVKINGHMHGATLEGDQITVGSFTGGGLVNHFQLPSDEDPETAGEVTGAPYAFDILTFGQDCSLSSLTRYSYRNLVLGRPQFDNVSIINGSRIADPPEQERSCGDEVGVSTTPFADLVPPDETGDDAGDSDEDGAPVQDGAESTSGTD